MKLHRSLPGTLLLVVLGGSGVFAGCARGRLVSLAGGGPPDGGGPGPVDPPPGPTDFFPTAGLTSAAAGPGAVRVHWRGPGTKPENYELALFRGTSRANVYDSDPVATNLQGTSLMGTGLPDGERVFVGLGIRPAGSSDPFTPTGAVLSATPGPVIYVDATASPDGADGMTPATAFPDPRIAILVAGFSLGGGNVWVREGVYPELAFIAQGSGVHVYGGFGADFDLATRDPDPARTRFEARVDAPGTPTIVLEIQELPTIPITNPIAILDGIHFDGLGIARQAVQVTEAAVEVRCVRIENFLQRGLRLQSLASGDFDAVLAGSEFSRNGFQGVAGDGAFDFFIDGCTFNSNTLEGMDLGDWVAPPGGRVSMRMDACRFFGNGAQGLDVNLNVPPFVLDLTGGEFAVKIRGTSFERNGLTGCLMDVDYDFFPQWSAEFTLEECLARANGGDGFHFDLDAPASALAHRVLAVGNLGAGLGITSESDPGVFFVSSSAFLGNQGGGILGEGPPAAVGNRAIAVAQSVVAGNGVVGISSRDVPAWATSTVFHLQPNPAANTTLVSCPVVEDPLVPVFQNLPSSYSVVQAAVGGDLTLASPAPFDPGTTIEVGDDGQARTASLVAGSEVRVDPEPDLVLPPDLLTAFDGRSVIEDYRLAPGSPASGSGLVAPGAPAVDAGVFRDASRAFEVPGFADEIRRPLFHPFAVTPPPTAPIDPFSPIEIAFNASLDPASASGTTLRILDTQGRELGTAVQSQAEVLVLTPPPGGWPSPFVQVELYDGLRSQGGVANDVPLALRFSTAP